MLRPAGRSPPSLPASRSPCSRVVPPLLDEDKARGGLADVELTRLTGFGQAAYGSRYRVTIERTGPDCQTLRNYAWVTGRFEVSRRRDTSSFAHPARPTHAAPKPAAARCGTVEPSVTSTSMRCSQWAAFTESPGCHRDRRTTRKTERR